MPTISVIIPVYKVEPYLSRCIDSVLNQVYTDFELILVDDGSPDCCGRICDAYAQKDDRIKVIHQTNSGVSAARNKGMDLAEGKFVVFIDSDDWVDENYLLALSKGAADFVGHSFSTCNETGKLLNAATVSSCDIPVNKESVHRLLMEGVLGYTFCKRFSLDIIRENNVRFNEQINHTEDTLFTLDYLQYATSARIENERHYFYIRYETRETLSNGSTLERLSMICQANSIICAKLFAKDSAEYEQLFYSRIGYSYMSYMDAVWVKKLTGPIQLYKFLSSIHDNDDVRKILRYAPDAVWKLSLHSRVINALQQQSRIKLFVWCMASRIPGKER